MNLKAKRPLRVIQWSTGNAGKRALRGILHHPDLELVGVHAYSKKKVGRDAAELCGWPEATGIIATDDVEALLAMDADCVCYTAQGETRMPDAIEELCRILSSGKNVVNTSMVALVYPPSIKPRLRDRLAKACDQGHSSLFTSGMDPGFSGDVIPLALAACCERIDTVRVSEIMDYSTYQDPGFTGVFFGFGRPLDYEAPLLQPGMLRGGWGGMVQLLADAFGMQLDEIREAHERLPAPEDFDTAMGRINKGSCAGISFEVQGIVAGRPALVAAHVNRLRDDIGPHWDRMSGGKKSGYRMEVGGSPSFACEIELHAEHGDHAEAGIISTAMRVVNAIPAVCAAQPGLLSIIDLPLFTARTSHSVP